MICGIIIGLLAFLNTRARRQEINPSRTGKGSPSVATLFLGKALVLGVVGAACGFGLGTVLMVGDRNFKNLAQADWGPEQP